MFARLLSLAILLGVAANAAASSCSFNALTPPFYATGLTTIIVKSTDTMGSVLQTDRPASEHAGQFAVTCSGPSGAGVNVGDSVQEVDFTSPLAVSTAAGTTDVWALGTTGIGVRVTVTSPTRTPTVISSSSVQTKIIDDPFVKASLTQLTHPSSSNQTVTVNYKVEFVLLVGSYTGIVWPTDGFQINELMSIMTKALVNPGTTPATSNVAMTPKPINVTTTLSTVVPQCEGAGITAPNTTVTLAKVSTGAFPSIGSTAGRKLFSFPMGCESISGGPTVEVWFQDANDLTNTSEIISSAPVANQASGVGLRMIDLNTTATNGQSVKMGRTNHIFVPVNQSNLSWAVEYIRTGTVSAGKVKGMVQMNYFYE